MTLPDSPSPGDPPPCSPSSSSQPPEPSSPRSASGSPISAATACRRLAAQWRLRRHRPAGRTCASSCSARGRHPGRPGRGAVPRARARAREHWLWHDLPDALGESSPPWYLVLGLPVVGAAIVAPPADSCPATAATRRSTGLARRRRRSRTRRDRARRARHARVRRRARAEAPVIALGTAVGVAVTPFVRARARQASDARRRPARSPPSRRCSADRSWPGMMMVEGGVGLGARLIPRCCPASSPRPSAT